MNKKLVGSLVVGLALVLGTSANLSAKSNNPDTGYTAKDKEFYLTEAQVAFIRPGLEFELLSFDIPADLQPVAEFTIKDEGGLPLDMDGVYTLGDVDIRFMLTYIPDGEEQKVSYTNGSRDRDGVYTTISQGHYTYKFSTVLPADYDQDATTTLASVATRDLRDFDLPRYYDNDVLNYVPSGAFDPMPRDVVRTDTCNRCHDPLGEHGGRYQEVQVCQQCHNPGMIGRSGDPVPEYSLDQLIHRVHIELGSEFPFTINDCEGCHTGGIPTEEFPLVAGPNPIPVCDGSGYGSSTLTWQADSGVHLKLDSADGKLVSTSAGSASTTTGEWIADGQVFVLVDAASGDVLQELPVHTTALGCNNNQPGTFRGEAGVLHTRWMTRPSRDVCGSCHSHVDFETGEGHPGGSAMDDSRCANCHRPTTGNEYDRSVDGAHTVDYKSNQLAGLIMDVLKIESAGPGQKPLVTFSLNDKNGPLDPTTLNRMRFTITGPNDDFDYYVQEDIMGKLVASGSNWTYRFDAAMPKSATGSYSFGVEGRKAATLNAGEDNEFTMNDQLQNFIVPFAVTDDEVVPRRMAVDDEKCENCHSNLSLHGSNRHDATGYCYSCHRPDETDAVVRLEGEDEGIHFKYMVHKIHRGEDLDRGYVVYGYRSSIHDYGHVEYPGDLRNCETCHVDDSYELPIPDFAADTTAPADFWSPLAPASSTCMSCHDSQDTAAHVDANISGLLGESCNTCHGDGATFSVERVHAR